MSETTPKEDLRPPASKRRKVIIALSILAAIITVGVFGWFVYSSAVNAGQDKISSVSKKLSREWDSTAGFTLSDKTSCTITGCTTTAIQVFLAQANQTMEVDTSAADALMPKIDDYSDTVEYLKAMEEYAKLMSDPVGNGIIVAEEAEQKATLNYVDDEILSIMDEDFEKDIVSATGDDNTWFVTFQKWNGKETNGYGPNGNYSIEAGGDDKSTVLADARNQALDALKDGSTIVGEIYEQEVTLQEALSQGYAPIVVVYSVE